MDPKNLRLPSPIHNASLRCQATFTSLLEVDNNPDVRSAVEDNYARFRIWAGNLGAFQPLPSRSSADFRLREAPEVASRILEILQDISETNEDIGSAAAESAIPEAGEDDEDEANVLNDLCLSVGDSLRSLLKVSALLRKATTRDRYALAVSSKHDTLPKEYEWYDERHVCEKFPKLLQQQWLLERLAKAITQRRRYLRYAEKHEKRVALDASSTQFASLFPPALDPALQVRDKDHLSSGHTLTATAASTKASTLQVEKVGTANLAATDADDDDNASQATSFISTATGEDNPHRAQVVKLHHLAEQGEPFLCPYCRGIVQFRNQKAWRRHVFHDLRAYVCTHPDCDAGLFEDKVAWFNHELEEHRRTWLCLSCPNKTFTFATVFESHLRKAHHYSDPSIIASVSASSSRPEDEIKVNACPLCDDWHDTLGVLGNEVDTTFVSRSLFREHLGSHLEQLALFAITPDIERDLDSEHGSNDGVPGSDKGLVLKQWQNDIESNAGDDDEFHNGEDEEEPTKDRVLDKVSATSAPHRDHTPAEPKPSEFFVVGRVFMAASAGSSTDEAQGSSDQPRTVSPGDKFVVLQRGETDCLAAPIRTYDGFGVANLGQHARWHAAIYSDDGPFLTDAERSVVREFGFIWFPFCLRNLRSDARGGGKLSPLSRLCFGDAVRVAHDSQTFGLGRLDLLSCDFLSRRRALDRLQKKRRLATLAEPCALCGLGLITEELPVEPCSNGHRCHATCYGLYRKTIDFHLDQIPCLVCRTIGTPVAGAKDIPVEEAPQDSDDEPQIEDSAEIIDVTGEVDEVEATPKGILKKPTDKFREESGFVKEASANPINSTKGIPPGARWTKISRRLVSPRALIEAGERFEERLDYVIVLRVLKREEIRRLAERTREIPAGQWEDPSANNEELGLEEEHTAGESLPTEDPISSDSDSGNQNDVSQNQTLLLKATIRSSKQALDLAYYLSGSQASAEEQRIESLLCEMTGVSKKMRRLEKIKSDYNRWKSDPSRRASTEKAIEDINSLRVDIKQQFEPAGAISDLLDRTLEEMDSELDTTDHERGMWVRFGAQIKQRLRERRSGQELPTTAETAPHSEILQMDHVQGSHVRFGEVYEDSSVSDDAVLEAKDDSEEILYSCDLCHSHIFGLRYRCLRCEDYDLCVNCWSRKDVVLRHEHDARDFTLLRRRRQGIIWLWTIDLDHNLAGRDEKVGADPKAVSEQTATEGLQFEYSVIIEELRICRDRIEEFCLSTKYAREDIKSLITSIDAMVYVAEVVRRSDAKSTTSILLDTRVLEALRYCRVSAEAVSNLVTELKSEMQTAKTVLPGKARLLSIQNTISALTEDLTQAKMTLEYVLAVRPTMHHNETGPTQIDHVKEEVFDEASGETSSAAADRELADNKSQPIFQIAYEDNSKSRDSPTEVAGNSVDQRSAIPLKSDRIKIERQLKLLCFSLSDQVVSGNIVIDSWYANTGTAIRDADEYLRAQIQDRERHGLPLNTGFNGYDAHLLTEKERLVLNRLQKLCQLGYSEATNLSYLQLLKEPVGFPDVPRSIKLVSGQDRAVPETATGEITLRELLLGEHQYRLNRRQRYYIALQISNLFLQLQSAGSPARDWCQASNIRFPVTNGDLVTGIKFEKPYVVTDHNTDAEDKNDMLVKSDRGFFGLAIVLMELIFGTCFEDHPLWQDLGLPDKKQDAFYRMTVARQWADTVEEEAGSDFSAAVTWCLNESSTTLDDEDWQKDFADRVVLPIQRICEWTEIPRNLPLDG